ncbi:MAG: YdcF family protein [Rhizomicrobium sp.]
MAEAARSHPGRTWLTAALVFLAAYGFGFVVFVSRIPTDMKRIDQADGIVALTGGDVRLMAAESLFEGKVGKRLLISGVHPGTTKADIKQLVNGGPRFDCCADMGFQATNTRGNALEAADWARDHHYRSLVVVTSNYHMPRSLLEFADVMPNVKLMPYPVEQADVDPQSWWSNGHVFRVLQGEYAKYLGSLMVTTLFPNGLSASRHSEPHDKS